MTGSHAAVHSDRTGGIDPKFSLACALKYWVPFSEIRRPLPPNRETDCRYVMGLVSLSFISGERRDLISQIRGERERIARTGISPRASVSKAV